MAVRAGARAAFRQARRGGACCVPVGGRGGDPALAKLGKEQLVALHVMHRQGQPNTATAKLLGVSEGTVRYHVKRAAEGAIDGRQKDHLIERLDLEEVVRSWWSAQAVAT